METEIVDGRQERGLQIAKTSRLRKSALCWLVPSQSGHGTYKVRTGSLPDCSCPDCQTRRVKCKHIWAVEYFLKEVKDSEGNAIKTSAMKITYTQDWPAYNSAQVSEKELFMKLLGDLCATVEQEASNLEDLRFH